MNTIDHEPADTRSMGIVHGALRRDLVRARMVLESGPDRDDRHRRALADHLVWLMDFLHAHHTGEDRGLWPLVRQRNPSAGFLLDRMDADHKRIAPAIDGLARTARSYRTRTQASEQVIAALTALEAVLLPHLAAEELEMMPVVATSITTQEYRDVERRFFVRPKGFSELGIEYHWLADGLDQQRRDLIAGVVPPIPRFVLLHGFDRQYRRYAAALWAGGPAAEVPPLGPADVARGT
ncbi:hemerythrin domain-containing protein [Gordonia sp. NPDC003376]